MKPIYCQNCEWTGGLDGEDYTVLGHVEELETRLTPGEIVPAGECPDCGALLQLGTKPTEGAPSPPATVNKAFEVLARVGYRTVDEEKEHSEAVKVLAEIFDGAIKQFQCPQCGGSHFGTSGCLEEGEMVGNCHSCRRRKSFTWPRKDDDKYFQWVIRLPSNMVEDRPKSVTGTSREEDP